MEQVGRRYWAPRRYNSLYAKAIPARDYRQAGPVVVVTTLEYLQEHGCGGGGWDGTLTAALDNPGAHALYRAQEARAAGAGSAAPCCREGGAVPGMRAVRAGGRSVCGPCHGDDVAREEAAEAARRQLTVSPQASTASSDLRVLEILTKALDVAVGDQAGGEAQERFMDVVASFPADPEAAEAVQPGDRALDDVAEDAQAGAVGLAPSGDHGPDAALPEQASVDVVVVAAVGQQRVRPPAGPADPARDGWDLVEKGQQLGDVVAVAAGHRYRERDALSSVDDEVVLAARPCTVDRARPAFGPRRAARTCEESITARSQSSRSFDRSSFSSNWWSRSQTPASFQAARRHQHVIPEPKPSSWGRYSHWIPVCRTKGIPHSTCRSGTRGRPSAFFGPGFGNNGSTSDHSSSDTIHGRD